MSARVVYLLMTYNQREFVTDAVASALAQTFSPLEILISDEASSDGTYDAIVDEVSRYGGPHIVRLHRNQSRQGSVAHLASAIEAIGNDAFVIMAHGDDVARPDRAGARIGGRGHIGTEVEIGIGTTVIDRITVGARTIVGAGAVVIRDCPADAIMIGVPARAREK